MSGLFEGHQPRECGEHRTLGGRAWCFDCSEYCSPECPCTRCEIPAMRKRLIEAESTVGRVEAFAKDMRTWCSPYGIASQYADRLEDALRGAEGNAEGFSGASAGVEASGGTQEAQEG